MIDEVRKSIKVPKSEVDAHINDQEFANHVIEVLDGWIENGTVKI